MEKVLFIAYYFPPRGGAGVQRALKFVKYLPEFGWQPYVLTTRSYQSTLRDDGLLKEIPAETPIMRTAALLPPQRLPWRLRSFISRWFLLSDEQIGWLPFAINAGRKAITTHDIKAIFSTSAPYSAHLVAHRLHRMTGLPWLADFRDPWFDNFYLRFATPLHRSMIRHLEESVVREAARITVVSPPMGESFYKRIPGLSPGKISWLANGFDGQDFVTSMPNERVQGQFHLVHSGTFYHQGRTADSILDAISSLVSNGQIPRHKLRVQLVGELGKTTYQRIKALGLEDLIETPGYVPHEQSIGYILAADALLLVIGEFPGSSNVYTGKIFEYLAAGKPILCLAGEGVSTQLIRDTHAGEIAPPDDVARIQTSLLKMYQAWENGTLKIDPDRERINSFERRKLTGALAELLTKACTN